MLDTLPYLLKSGFPQIKRNKLTTLQVNVGYLCNQQCLHCHVNAGPNRKEAMTMATAESIIDFIDSAKIETLDLTGGAPELHEVFRYLVIEGAKRNVHIIDRCNLTVLFEEGQSDLAEFLAEHKVEVVASLPCYFQENVDQQRGKGVFDLSIAGLQKLNELGYAKEGTGLELNLVYNPQGAQLPPGQEALELDYKKKLKEDFNIEFNQLFVITNLPIQRFGSMLLSKGIFDDYMSLLKGSFSAENLKGVMCKSLISVGYDGQIFDCDFNQMLDMKTKTAKRDSLNINDLELNELDNNPIIVAEHCYGCTSGQGSSCGGALS
jgi:radical SAM/Cys-rich protein